MSKQGHWMFARYDGECGECGAKIQKGERICYVPKEKTALCSECGQGIVGPDPEGEKK